MPKWTDYTIKANPADKDEMMILDTAGKANKRLGLSALSDWIIGKIADKVFENLQTQNKTILGAINELNSNPLSILARNAILLKRAFDYNELKTTGVYYLTDDKVLSSDNRPNDNCTNCYLLIFAYNTKRVTQIVLPGNHPYALYRSLLTDSNTWLEWKTIK